MKYSFLIIVLLLLLLPEVSPNGYILFSDAGKTEAAVVPEAESSRSRVFRCPSTPKDPYLKQAFCSCRSLLTAAPAEAGTPKMAVQKKKGPQEKGQDQRLLATWLGFPETGLNASR